MITLRVNHWPLPHPHPAPNSAGAIVEHVFIFERIARKLECTLAGKFPRTLFNGIPITCRDLDLHYRNTSNHSARAVKKRIRNLPDKATKRHTVCKKHNLPVITYGGEERYSISFARIIARIFAERRNFPTKAPAVSIVAPVLIIM